MLACSTHMWTKAFDERIRQSRKNSSLRQKVIKKRADRQYMINVRTLAATIPLDGLGGKDPIAQIKNRRRLRDKV